MGLSIGYHAKTGKFDPAKEPKEHREFYGTGVLITRGERPGLLRHQHQGRAEARLERHLGPRQRPDPVQLSRQAPTRRCACRAPGGRTRSGRVGPLAAGSRPGHRPPAAGQQAPRARRCAHRRLGAAHRPGRCSARIIAVINPNFLTFGNFVRIAQTATIPLVARHRRHLHHPDGLDRPLGRRRADARRGDPVDAGAERRQRQRLRPPRRAGRCCWSAPAIGFINGVIHVRLRIPSFMTTLGMWFIGVGVANAILGGMAVADQRPDDPRPRHRALPRPALGRLAGARPACWSRS